MKIEKECRDCVLSQAKRVVDILGLDDEKSRKILELASSHIEKFDPDLPPPQNASTFYEDIAKYLHVEDIYKDYKQNSSKKAKELVPTCRELLRNSREKLYLATKIAVVGNVIDLASQIQFDLKDEFTKIINTPFEIDNFEELKTALKSAKKLTYLADNAGEEVFDKIFIEVIKEEFKDLEIFYFTRGVPIINDLTYEDAVDAKMFEVASIIDSGVKTPGFNLEGASKNALKIFKESDLVIAKGMGNYECLSEYRGFDIFYLLKVKCSVVANSVGANLGSIICKKS